MPRTATGLIIGAIASVLLVIVVIVILQGIHPSSANTSSDNNYEEAMKNTENNVILGMVILGILGTFGIIAYYYHRNIDFGSKK